MAWAVDLLFFICAFAAPVAVAFGMLADVEGQDSLPRVVQRSRAVH